MAQALPAGLGDRCAKMTGHQRPGEAREVTDAEHDGEVGAQGGDRQASWRPGRDTAPGRRVFWRSGEPGGIWL